MDLRIAIVYNNFISISMNGKRRQNYLSNLGGKKLDVYVTPRPIVDMEQTIIENIVLPLVNSQWNTVQENLFLVDILKLRVDNYIKYYNMPSLLLYKQILIIYSKFLSEHIQLSKLERTLYPANKDNLSIFFYKTSMIKLKPEYSLYNLIIGPPNLANNETHDPLIIHNIIQLLSKPNINFQTIKTMLLENLITPEL
jgi:hypothetical protein